MTGKRVDQKFDLEYTRRMATFRGRTRYSNINLKLATFGLTAEVVQNQMPGKRWTISNGPWTRTFTTAELETFLDGYGKALADKDLA